MRPLQAPAPSACLCASGSTRAWCGVASDLPLIVHLPPLASAPGPTAGHGPSAMARRPSASKTALPSIAAVCAPPALGALLQNAALVGLGADVAQYLGAAQAVQSHAGQAGPLGTADEAGEGTEEGAGGLAADHPLLGMDPDERALYLQSRILGEVNAMIGHPVTAEEPLIAAGGLAWAVACAALGGGYACAVGGLGRACGRR